MFVNDLFMKVIIKCYHAMRRSWFVMQMLCKTDLVYTNVRGTSN